MVDLEIPIFRTVENDSSLTTSKLLLCANLVTSTDDDPDQELHPQHQRSSSSSSPRDQQQQQQQQQQEQDRRSNITEESVIVDIGENQTDSQSRPILFRQPVEDDGSGSPFPPPPPSPLPLPLPRLVPPSTISSSLCDKPSLIRINETDLIRHVWAKEIDIIHQWLQNNQSIGRHEHIDIPTAPTTTTKNSSTTTTPLDPGIINNKNNNNNNGMIPIPPPAVPITISTTATTEFLIVTGPTGCGKGKLIQAAALSRHDDDNDGDHGMFGRDNYYYMHGAFDSTSEHDPYRACQQAVMHWTDQVMAATPPPPHGGDIIASIRDAIISGCGDTEHGMDALLQCLPSLSAMINYRGDDYDNYDHVVRISSTNSNNDIPSNIDGVAVAAAGAFHIPIRNDDDDAIRRTQQNHYCEVFHQFLRVISSSKPIVLVLEDLHYADPSSMDVLCYILTNRIPNVFVIGTYVGNSFEKETLPTTTTSTNYFVDRIRDTERNSHTALTIQTIPIRNLNDEQVTYVLNQIIQSPHDRSPNDIDELCAVVVEETHGNVFLITEFLRWLQGNGLLQKTANGWTWTIDDLNNSISVASSRQKDHAILETKFYISSRLEHLPTLMLDILKVGACFGSSHIEIRLIQKVLNCPIHTMIEDATKLGILECVSKDKSQYSFIHEEMKNAAYGLIPEEGRELFHLEIGRRLWRRLDRNEMDHHMFVILSQLQIGRRLILRPVERYNIASLCLHAGQLAAKSSTFRVALVNFKFGIEVLGGDIGWRDEYDVSLLIHNAAAEMEMCNANYEGMESLVAAVERHSRRPEDTIPARTTLLHCLLVNNQQIKGLDLGMELLSNLGYGLSQNFQMLSMMREMHSIRRLLKGKSNDDLKRLPLISDEKVLASMHILNLMFVHALLERPVMASLIALKMMQLTLRYGLCFISPVAFCAYGMLCISARSDRDAAFRFAELALELIDTLQVREYIPRVYGEYYSCIHPWRYNIRDALDPLIYAHHIGLQTGDLEFSFLCASLWLVIAFDSGIPLDEIDTQWSCIYKSIRSCRQQSLLHLIVPATFLYKYHLGEDIDPCELDTLLQSSRESGLLTAKQQIVWAKAEIALLYNKLELADEISISAGLSKEFWKAPTSPDLVNMSFINGMISFASLGSDYKGPHRRRRWRYLREGNAMLRSLTTYARWCPVNFVHKKLLLEAERAVAIGQNDLATEKYVCAIATSKENRSLPAIGFSNERYGRFCFNVLNRRDDATLHFKQALLSYREWKGQRKVDQLLSDLLRMFGREDYDKFFE